MREHHAGVVGQYHEQVELLGRERDRLPGHAHRALLGVDLEIARADDIRGGPLAREAEIVHAAQKRLDAQLKLLGDERLHEVVVGAELEADGFVHDVAARCEQDDRRAHAGGAQAAAHSIAVESGHHHVENDEVGLDIEGALVRLDAVRGAHALIAALLDDARNQHAHPLVVVSEQDLRHASSPSASSSSNEASSTGSRTVNTLPTPNSDSTATLPSSNSAYSRTSASPSPLLP